METAVLLRRGGGWVLLGLLADLRVCLARREICVLDFIFPIGRRLRTSLGSTPKSVR